MSEPNKGDWRLLYEDQPEDDDTFYSSREAAMPDALRIAHETDNWVGIEEFDGEQWWLHETVGTPVARDWTSQSTVCLGDYVIAPHGYRGRVHQVHPYGCPESDDWLAIQEIPVTQYKRERWVSVLVHDSGAVVAPMALCEVIEPFPFTHSSAHLYFREES